MEDPGSKSSKPAPEPLRGPGVRPEFRPRVVVRLRASVDIPYVEGAEQFLFKKYGIGPLDDIAGHITFRRLYSSVSEEELRDLEERARRQDPSFDAPPFTSWFTIETPPGVRPEEFAELLRRWDIVEEAHPDAQAVDPSVNAADDPRAVGQTYLGSAPLGINAEFAWTKPGGNGAGQRVIDLEMGWTLDHQDFVSHGATLLFGTVQNASRAHGSAALGLICASDDTVGGVGIAPAVDWVGVTSHSGSLSNVPDALLGALPSLTYGDVLMLEVQTVTPAARFGAPIELIDACFHAVRLATSLGVIVVAAAGNGNLNLDQVANSAGQRVLNRGAASFRDSGAIIVGAATSTSSHSRVSSSSYGRRVDCYAWGENVSTAWSDWTGSTSLYTSTFRNTSAATPIVAGAALAVQGVLQAAGRPRFGPHEMRTVLSNPSTGTASANPATNQIGVMPDLKAIIQALGI